MIRNLKDLDYQPDQPQQSDKLKLPIWVKVSKEIFNEMLSIATKAKNNKLKTSTNKEEFTLDDDKRLLKGQVNGKIDRNEAKERYNKTFDNVNTILEARITKNREKIVEILILLKEIFMNSKTDKKKKDKETDEETDEKTDDQKDDEQPDTTDMLELESDESAPQRRNQSALKILTPDQMLNRLPITLAQLKAGNNSEKL